MRSLSTSEILDIWERGQAASSEERALLFLTRVFTEFGIEELSRMHIGKRDAMLLEIYEMIFGSILACETVCPGCGERLELSLRSDELRVPGPDLHQTPAELSLEGYDVSFRLPDSLDLSAASHCPDLTSATRVLIKRCILKAHKDGEECDILELPGPVIDAISGRMEEMDPQANVQIDLTCPSCSRRWAGSFDVLPFLWMEVDVMAKRTLREVHLLASSYGWSETEILKMSRWRRRAYLEMTGP